MELTAHVTRRDAHGLLVQDAFPARATERGRPAAVARLRAAVLVAATPADV